MSSKVVLFDWGGVIESHENNCQATNEAIVRLIKKYNPNLSDDYILSNWTIYTPNGLSMHTINDDISIQEWINIIKERMNINISYEEFEKAYKKEMSKLDYYSDVVDYIYSLKGKCKIGVLSNLFKLDKERLGKQINLDKLDYIFLSYEIGEEKPNDKIYEYVIEKINIDVENILFIDDNENNILSAKKLGLKTCNARGYELDKIIKSVEEFLDK